MSSWILLAHDHVAADQLLPGYAPDMLLLDSHDMHPTPVLDNTQHDSVGLGLVLDNSQPANGGLGLAVSSTEDQSVIAQAHLDGSSQIQHAPSGSASVGRRGKIAAPKCSIVIRRSTRSNKYDGFSKCPWSRPPPPRHPRSSP